MKERNVKRRFANFFGRHPILFGVVGLFLILLLLVAIKALQIRKMMATPMVMPPTTVSSVQVKQEDWPPVFSSIGTVSAVQGATVSAELAGTVAEIKFENGGLAKKGDVLMRLDASSEEAQMKSAEADLELARSDLARARDLAQRNVVSKAELDAAESKFKQKEGVVNNMRSMIAKKEVLAPFDGQLGIRQVNVGQMITAGQQVVSLQALDPLYVDFALPQQDLPKLSAGLEVRVHTDVVAGSEFPGKLTALNSAVDPVTRNVTLQATIENKDHALRPGMFAKIDVLLPDKQKTLVVPGTAISYAPYGDSVFVIEKKKDEKTGKESQVLRQQFVRIGEARGDFVSITKGLEDGQQIVSTGVFKLRNGIPVVINNDLAPKPQLNPKPADT
ncbi:MAG TPA: efflux RND transporter periplasmic adaptor subunit [Chthoniobacterales bacterium]|nr:efflux RND transporter periplasmic adaptor subunit [Chthoniobacterales bacterium]